MEHVPAILEVDGCLPGNSSTTTGCMLAGELYDQIRMRGKLDEGSARFYAAEVVLMLEVLRREGVMHR